MTSNADFMRDCRASMNLRASRRRGTLDWALHLAGGDLVGAMDIKSCGKDSASSFHFFSSLLSADTWGYSNLVTVVETPSTIFIWSVVTWASVPLLYAFPYNDQKLEVGLAWNAPGSPWTETARRLLLATIPVAAVYLIEKLLM